ncbi:hypothetical protein GCM10027051_32540 [Niabella terrae]
MTHLQPFDQLKRKIILYRKSFDEYSLEVRPLSLTRDIKFIHKWVNMDYTQAFWQMGGSFEKVRQHYESLLETGEGYSIVFFIQGRKVPVALMDIYFPYTDEIGTMYDVDAEDTGVHLLMGPADAPIGGLTTNVMKTGLSFIFSLGPSRVIGEPDARNKKANDLVKRVGFKFIKPVTMSYKTANLYILERDDFLNLSQLSSKF